MRAGDPFLSAILLTFSVVSMICCSQPPPSKPKAFDLFTLRLPTDIGDTWWPHEQLRKQFPTYWNGFRPAVPGSTLPMFPPERSDVLRLLFAEMFSSRPWNPGAIVSASQAVGVLHGAIPLTTIHKYKLPQTSDQELMPVFEALVHVGVNFKVILGTKGSASKALLQLQLVEAPPRLLRYTLSNAAPRTELLTDAPWDVTVKDLAECMEFLLRHGTTAQDPKEFTLDWVDRMNVGVRDLWAVSLDEWAVSLMVNRALKHFAAMSFDDAPNMIILFLPMEHPALKSFQKGHLPRSWYDPSSGVIVVQRSPVVRPLDEHSLLDILPSDFYHELSHYHPHSFRGRTSALFVEGYATYISENWRTNWQVGEALFLPGRGSVRQRLAAREAAVTESTLDPEHIESIAQVGQVMSMAKGDSAPLNAWQQKAIDALIATPLTASEVYYLLSITPGDVGHLSARQRLRVYQSAWAIIHLLWRGNQDEFPRLERIEDDAQEGLQLEGTAQEELIRIARLVSMRAREVRAIAGPRWQGIDEWVKRERK